MSSAPATLQELAQWTNNRIQAKKRAVFLITGETGIGKSGFGLMFMDEIMGWEQGRLNVRRQVVRSESEWEAARKLCGPGEPIMDDESVASGSNVRRPLSGENVAKMVSINTGRKLLQPLVFVMPFFDDFDKRQLKHVDWRLDLKEPRGNGQAYEVQKVGLQKTGIWLEPRFPFKYPNCEEVRPDLWEPYMERAMADERGEQKSFSLEQEQRIRARALRAQRVLGRFD